MKLFFRISEANAEISRLAEENAKAAATLAGVSQEVESLKQSLADAQAIMTQKDSDLSAAKTSIAELGEKITAKDAEIAAATKAIDDANASAAVKAAEIAASQGIPAGNLPGTESSKAETVEDLHGQMRAEADPVKRAAIYTKIQALWNR